MTTYSLVDVANLFHRCRHVVKGSPDDKVGMTLTIVFRSLRKLHREMKIDHIVLCLEGHSWRYDVFPQYKAKRKLDKLVASASKKEREEEELFFQTLNDFCQYMSDKTNCTVLQSDKVEGDDWVARWIQLHPNDEHIIVSGDTDFLQLLAPNVQIYNGMDHNTIKCEGIFNEYGKPLVFTINGSNGKLKLGPPIDNARKKHEEEQQKLEKKHNTEEKARAKLFEYNQNEQMIETPGHKPKLFVASSFDWQEFDFVVEPEWWKKALFVKLIRGDTSDGIFSAYPGIRYKGSKNSVGIEDAWKDRNSQGFNWNNFMLQRWDKVIGTDEHGNVIKQNVRVLDEYKFNEQLIDLTMQPKDVISLMDEIIVRAIQKQPVNNIGIHFLKFCGRHNLPSIAKEASDHAAYLLLGYT